MPLVACFTMTTERSLSGAGLVGRGPGHSSKSNWDLSFMDSDSFTSTENPPHALRVRGMASGLRQGLEALVHTPEGLNSVIRRHSTVPLQTSSAAESDGRSPIDQDHVPISDLTGFEPSPSSSTGDHVYQNGAMETMDSSVDELADPFRLEGSRFFFPVIKAPPRLTGRASNPRLTVTPSESETESRSQSISSQDSAASSSSSSDQDNAIGAGDEGGRTDGKAGEERGVRAKNDSGIGLACVDDTGFPRRNSSASALNDLNVVVCRPSPSPIVEFHQELLLDTSSSIADCNCSSSLHKSVVEQQSTPSAIWPMTSDTPGHDSYMRVARFLPAWDLERLSLVFYRLSICRFYLGKMTFDDAKLLLKGYPVGTFFLRDSSDNRFLFSLSVQTSRGTTSIRIIYEAGHFRLDCEPEQLHLMPTFSCVIQLIRHYIRLAKSYRRKGVRNNFVFLESTGRKDTPVLLRMPYASKPATLKHLCRLKINGIVGDQSVDRLQLIPSLKLFLKDYPYDI